MYNTGYICCVLVQLFVVIGTISATENEDEGYCFKKDGITECVSPDHFNLTRLDGGQTGDVTPIVLQDGRLLQMKTLNTKPLVFEIPDFLSDEECEHFINVAKEIGMKASYTERQSSQQGVSLMDLNSDRKLNLAEMKLTIENGFDIYLEDEDVINMIPGPEVVRQILGTSLCMQPYHWSVLRLHSEPTNQRLEVVDWSPSSDFKQQGQGSRYKMLNIDTNNDNIITQAEMKGMSPKALAKYLQEYVSENPEKHSRFSKQAWLYPDQSSDAVFKEVQKRVSQVVQLPMSLIQLSDFQVVNYGIKGHYNAHLDSSHIRKDQQCCDRGRYAKCRICRYMTVLFYLNEVVSGGETAFPHANKDSINHTSTHLEREQHLYKKCEDANLRVSAERRKAIIWYNHFIDEQTGWMGEVDEFTLHGGCPVLDGEKWIANFWIKTNDDKSIDMKKIQKLAEM